MTLDDLLPFRAAALEAAEFAKQAAAASQQATNRLHDAQRRVQVDPGVYVLTPPSDLFKDPRRVVVTVAGNAGYRTWDYKDATA